MIFHETDDFSFRGTDDSQIKTQQCQVKELRSIENGFMGKFCPLLAVYFLIFKYFSHPICIMRVPRKD